MKQQNNRKILIVVSLLAVLVLSGCVSVLNEYEQDRCEDMGYGNYYTRYDCCGCKTDEQRANNNDTNHICCLDGSML